VKVNWKELLEISAGPRALSRIRDSGLSPGDVSVLAGPATGPRWIVIAGIDRALADSRWLNRSPGIWLWGASAAAWRFSAFAQKDPSAAIRLFQENYAGMQFGRTFNPVRVRREIERALSGFMPKSTARKEALIKGDHGPKLAVVTVRQKSAVEGMEKLIYLSSFLLNFLTPAANEIMVERVVFYSPPSPPPQLEEKDFPGRALELSPENLEKVLLATASVPLKVTPPDSIPGAFRGTYQDGGVLDYHINSCLFPCEDEGIILLITHPGKIMARWMDRFTPWRRISRLRLERLVVVQPSSKLLDLLPGRRLPSRKDWEEMKDQKERLSLWKRAMEISMPLGEVFMEAVESGAVKNMVFPI